MNLKRWFYRDGRPNRLTRVLDRGTAALYALGIAPNYLVTLEVPGRRSGRTITVPLVMAVVGNERYLVSMLGEGNWVKNVRAAGGAVTIRHGRREDVRLDEVPIDRRAPLLKAYLQRARNARAHLPVDEDAPLTDFAAVSPRCPVFRVLPGEREQAPQHSAETVLSVAT
jgi:F420H(2)-dependent quinone reductase